MSLKYKYKVGDSFLLRMTIDSVDEDCGDYCMGEEADGAWLSEKAIDKLSAKAAVYAAKAAPAPVSTAWEPKPGDRVLVEGKFENVDRDGNYHCAVETTAGEAGIFVRRSAIVGPAPVRARFAVGDVVFHVPSMDKVRITQLEDDGGCWIANNHNPVGHAKQADLLTLDEARERLGKK